MRTAIFRRVLSSTSSVARNPVSHAPPHISSCRDRIIAFSTGADAVEAPKAAMVLQLSADMKAAMKAKDKPRLNAIRFLQAAVKSREIDMRQEGKDVVTTDEDVIKLAKQRKDSIDSYKAGGRDDLADEEQVELDLLESYLPTMLDADEVEKLVDEAIAETGATSIKNMKPVMSAVAAKAAGKADSRMVSEIVKKKLQAM
eukprot:gene11251-18876_t